MTEPPFAEFMFIPDARGWFELFQMFCRVVTLAYSPKVPVSMVLPALVFSQNEFECPGLITVC